MISLQLADSDVDLTYCGVDIILRVPDQNCISRLYNLYEIYHSGPEPLICFPFVCFES